MIERVMRFLKKILGGARHRLFSILAPSPVKAYGERTMMFTPQMDASEPNDFLMDLAISTITSARNISLMDVSERRQPSATDYPELWPGHHYRLLAALVAVLQPQSVIEVGTYQGLSALALKKFLPRESTLTTFDVIPWTQVPGTCLRADDFSDNRLVQHICDLAQPRTFELHRTLLENADLIFLDGPKDGFFEKRFLEQFSKLAASKRKLLVFDDIRTWKMLAIWRQIIFPKLDLTSFGHWTGTGLVDWNRPTDAKD